MQYLNNISKLDSFGFVSQNMQPQHDINRGYFEPPRHDPRARRLQAYRGAIFGQACSGDPAFQNSGIRPNWRG